MTNLEILADIGKTKAEIQKLQEHLADIEKAVEQEEVTRFEPEEDEEYLFIDSGNKICKYTFNKTNSYAKMRADSNNVFRVSSEANLEKYAHDVIRVQNRLMQLHDELCPECWYQYGNSAHEIYYNRFCGWSDARVKPGTALGYIPFTEVAAYKACEILNNERFMMDEE